MRPFGALVFGRLGDMIGRKYTFLVTILIMGLSTFIVGLLPSYGSIGVAAPVILIGLRLLQGLALGGEYGGAATYVAEHAPHGKRGAFTSWIQTTATLGLFLSLLVILGVRTSIGEDSLRRLGLAHSVPGLGHPARHQRLDPAVDERVAGLQEDEGRGQDLEGAADRVVRPWKNLKIVLLALFGLTAGQAVVWYTGQFYALFFLTGALKVDGATANIMIAIALLIGTPFFIVFGSLSDKIGRKPIIMAGCLLAALTYFPLFQALTEAGQPGARRGAGEDHRSWSSPIRRECSFQFNPTGAAKFTSSCDVAKQVLAGSSVSYDERGAPAGSAAKIKIGDKVIDVALDRPASRPAEVEGARTPRSRRTSSPRCNDRRLSGEGEADPVQSGSWWKVGR